MAGAPWKLGSCEPRRVDRGVDELGILPPNLLEDAVVLQESGDRLVEGLSRVSLRLIDQLDGSPLERLGCVRFRNHVHHAQIRASMCAYICAPNKGHGRTWVGVPGGGRGRVPQVKVNVQIPVPLADRIESQIKKDGRAVSVADFMRQAAAREIDRLEGRGPESTELLVPTGEHLTRGRK